MSSHAAESNHSSTSVERVALGASINLSDSHARILDDAAIANLFRTAHRHFDVAAKTPQRTLEASFISSIEDCYSLRFPRTPLLSYSASSLAGLVGTFLGPASTVVWSIPSFDNIRDVVRNAGVRIKLLPESRFIGLVTKPPRLPSFDAIWLTMPNNPTGLVLNQDQYARLAHYAREAGILLVVDHCFRAYSPTTLSFDQYSLLEDSGCRYILLEDTGKTISSFDLKVGMLTGSSGLHDQLRLINEDLLLNVSPFILSILSTILREWHRTSGLERLRRTTQENRRLIRDVFVSSGLAPQMQTTEIPVEWLDTGSERRARELIEACASRGLHLLPGGSFFGRPNQAGSRFVRIALTKDTSVIVAGARILGETLKSGNV